MIYVYMDRRWRGFMSLFEFDYILPEMIPQTLTCANFNENFHVNFADEFHVTKPSFS
jgi:hypothetical protein